MTLHFLAAQKFVLFNSESNLTLTFFTLKLIQLFDLFESIYKYFSSTNLLDLTFFWHWNFNLIYLVLKITEDNRGLPKFCQATEDDWGLPKCCQATEDDRGLPKCCQASKDDRGLPKCCQASEDDQGLSKCCQATEDDWGLPKCCQASKDDQGLPKCCQPSEDDRGLPKCCQATEDDQGLPKFCPALYFLFFILYSQDKMDGCQESGMLYQPLSHFNSMCLWLGTLFEDLLSLLVLNLALTWHCLSWIIHSLPFTPASQSLQAHAVFHNGPHSHYLDVASI